MSENLTFEEGIFGLDNPTDPVMPVYSEDLSATANPAASLNQANLISQKTNEHWTDNAADMQFEEMFSFQNAETQAEPGSLDSIDLRLLNKQATIAANQQGSLLESIPPLTSFQNLNQQPTGQQFYNQNQFQVCYEKNTNQPFSCAAQNGMTVSDAFQQAFSSAENKISDEMTGIVRSDQLKTHTMTVIKSNHGGVMSLANNFDGFNERTLNEDLSSNGNALAPLNSNQLAELNNQPQLSQKCNNANDGDAIKSQEKQDEKGYRNDPTSQKKEKYGFATRRILENQDDELFPSFPDRPNTARFINENAAFSSASIPQNHRQSRVHSRKRNYERESATREIEIGPNDRQTKLEERLRLAKEATQRSAMIEKAREEQIAVKEARLRKNREENNIKRKEQEHREQQEQQKQQQIEQQKLQEQRLKAQKTIIVEPDEFILEEVNPHAPGSDLFNTATLTNLEDVQIIEGGFEEIDESRFVYMPEQQIQDYAGPSHIQPQSLIYDHSTFEIQGIPAELNKDSQNVTVIEEVEDEPAWKNDGLIKTQIMQEAFAWTEKANKFSTRKTIPREKLREERYSSQTDFAFMAFMRHVITHAMKSFNYPRMNSNNMLLWDLARDLKQSEDDKHEKFKENMKIMSKLLSMSNGKHQNTIFTDLVMFVQEKFKNGGKLEREAFFDEMTVQQKEEAKNRRARKVVKPGKVKKRGAKKLGRPRKNKSKISIAQEDQTASLNAQTPQ